MSRVLKRVILYSLFLGLSGEASEGVFSTDPYTVSTPGDYFARHDLMFIQARESDGDERYLKRYLNGNLLSLSTMYYPEDDNSEPIFQDAPPIYNEIGVAPDLKWGREFLIGRQFVLWASAYKFRNSKDPETRELASLCKNTLSEAYGADLFVQRRVEDLRNRYRNDTSVVIAGLTGAEVIAYMDEILPEPDPRALIKPGSGLTSPSNLTKRGNSEGAGAAMGPGADRSAGERSDWSGWLWFVCAVTSAGLAAAWYLRRRTSS